MDPRTLSHTLGFDDAPFARSHRGQVLVVGTAFAHLRLEGVLSLSVERDGNDATAALARTIAASKFAASTKVVLLQGIALAGFNVVDIHELAEGLGRPVVVVMRRPPRYEKVRRALLERTPGGDAKWALIQRAGLDLLPTGQLIAALATNGTIPEPLRVAHLIAGGVTTGESRGRA